VTISLHEQLRAETRAEHEALETALDLMRPDFRIADYVALLVQYEGFYAPFAHFLTGAAVHEPVLEALLNAVCQRQAWLQDDLQALGAAPDRDAAIAVESFSELYPGSAHTFGAMYVIEGSALGGATLAKHFTKALGLEQGSGLRFFAGYGCQTREKWLAALQLLAECDARGVPRAEIVEGSKQTFRLLQRQLTAAFAG
jgi:heme oxygenase (biliverdin-IX-beta and delta-forming)